ncbi:hypothetical protein EV421DRAFT_1899409 [Armillaria borealis]|uniref:F-box domain-containing protein n=1 Tax=Armillaria borealis TaxID=47425 RepID=A0AA39JY28_9AGAR|nr:hypothetical protein EV421DRAFT_1899409 [Armillaria borealis]
MTLDEPVCLLEDEPLLRRRKDTLCNSTYWPHLTHYESLAIRFDSRYPRSSFTKIKDDRTTSIINDSIFRRLRLEAFFLTLEGFYTGNSDLTGRHPDRFSYIWSRRSLLHSDMCQLMPLTVQSVESSVDFLGESCEDVVYTVANQAFWERFQSKWLVPKEGYGFVLGWTDLPEDVTDETRYAHKMEKFLNSVIRCLSQSHFLLTYPDITQRIEVVHITKGWFIYMDYDFPDTFAPTSLMSAIVQGICAVLRASTSLSTFRMFSYDINETFIQTFLALPRLHTLQLSRCFLSHNVIGETKLLPNVQNLSLKIFKETSSLWNILTLCPNVHNLIHFDLTEKTLAVSSDVIHFGNFCNLRRFSLGSIEDGFDGPAVGLVVDWLNRATEHHLTHFKLSVREPASDSAFLLLNALQPHPLEELIFDGLLEGCPVIFDRISQSFPQLCSLRLFRRSSNRQRKMSHCEWLSPPWEYARRLVPFSNLQYFGWNYLIIRDGYSPLSLEGGLDVDDCLDSDDDTYFAAYCPSLWTVAMFSREPSPYAFFVWDIEWVGGKVVINHAKTSEVFWRRVWNPWDGDEPDGWW